MLLSMDLFGFRDIYSGGYYMKEIWIKWKDDYAIPLPQGGLREFPAIYVSNFGNIKGRSINRDSYGYRRIHYKGKGFKVCNIVAECFMEDRPTPQHTIDHIDRVRDNDNINNLRWASKHEQNKNRDHTEINRVLVSHHNKKPVKCIETGKIFSSPRDAEVVLNISKGSVKSAANPNHKQKTAGGFSWIYIETEE